MFNNVTWGEFALFLCIALLIWWAYVIFKFWIPGMSASKDQVYISDLHNNPKESEEDEDFNERDMAAFLRPVISNKNQSNDIFIANNSINIEENSNIYSGLDKAVDFEDKPNENYSEEVEERHEVIDFPNDQLEDYFPEDINFNSDELDLQAEKFLRENEEGQKIEDEPIANLTKPKNENTVINEEQSGQEGKTFKINFDKFLDD